MIYGAGLLGRSIVQQIERSPESGFRVIGFIDDSSSLKGQVIFERPVLGNGKDLAALLKEYDPDELWIALPLSAMAVVSPVLTRADEAGTSVRLFPDLYGLSLLNHSVSEMLGFPMIDLNIDRMQGLNRTIKEVEDKLLAGGFLLIGLPLIGLIALLIRMESPGPIIFKQRRHGWDGKPFTIYKFRTMRLHQEPDGQLTQAQREDDRFTRMGKWLRRTSLDELPQLVNVLQGRMSMVGPRPHAIEHNEYYRQHIDGYMRRHRVKPGITGWAQINDLRGETQTIEEMSRRVKHDLYYIEHWSVWFDLRIVLTTLLKIFFSRKAW
jgi:putative colanic acid biosynthesis UDP-glucose lipid carrier transferase